MKDKKQIELLYLKKFLELLNVAPDSEIIETEAPDFLLQLGGKNIGVELTMFHSNYKNNNGLTRRAIEENWVLLKNAIMKSVDRNELLKNTSGLLFFKNLLIPSIKESELFIEELIRLSLYMINKKIKEIFPSTEYPLLNKYLSKFYLEKVQVYIEWDSNHNVATIGLSEEKLIKSIEKKLVANYKGQNIDEVWLIIVSGHRLSQAMGIQLINKLNNFNKFNGLLMQSKYNKVFIYQYMFSLIYSWPGWTKSQVLIS
jgi:hypothetical protein